MDAGAFLALASCEAGYEESMAPELVEAVCNAGFGSADSGLGGGGAAALALAAAVVGRADSSIFDALLTRCSAREEDLKPSDLGDLRLAASLAGSAATEGLDVRAAGFLSTLCADAALDEPRGTPASPTSRDGFAGHLTELELEVSAALHEAEVPHCRGLAVEGGFIPLASMARRQTAVFAEDVSSRAVYDNEPAERRAYQRWLLRHITGAGYKVFAVPALEWRGLADQSERASYLQKLLTEAPEVEKA
eukprot:TRINITY_DN30078_c0_g1_i13.p1 TRINITY_DN30078_c0_g1~~TRINITY_DN30078_c0_g1_i13.p1  ORF type:complete len:249 (-),score=63.65 TRINITY_DN30078_c0_g1_i13:141-887(-)